jgi:hypothetical protein
MLRKIAFLLATLILVFGFAVASWSSQQQPQNQQATASNSSPNCTAEQNKPTKTWGEGLSIIWNRTWDDPVAFYTFILSIFTALLALVSFAQVGFLIRADRTARLTAEAAKLSADAAIGVELPIISLAQIQLKNQDQGGRTAGAVVGPPGPVSKLEIAFRNLGRTPAELIAQCVEWAVVQKLPDTPIYKANFPYVPGTFIEAGEASTATLQNYFIRLQPGEITEIADDTKFLWVFGYLSFKDFLGKTHSTRFCAKWQPYVLQQDGALRPMGFVYDSATPPRIHKENLG